jgi:hypothetical protein
MSANDQVHFRHDLPVGFDKRTRILSVECQTVSGHTIRGNRLVSHMELIGPGYASLRHLGAKRVRSRGAGAGASGIGICLGRVDVRITGSRWVWIRRILARVRARRVRRTSRESVDWQMRAIDLTPLRVTTLFTLGKGRNELVCALGDPARLFIVVLCVTSVWVGCWWLWGSVDLSLSGLARPLVRKGYIIIRVIIRSTVTMGVRRWPCSGILGDSGRHDLAGRGSVELCGSDCMVNRRQRCRSGNIRSVRYHGGSNITVNYYNKR